MSKFRLHHSLRLKILVTFVACLFITSLLQISIDFVTQGFRKIPYTSYESSKNRINGKLALIESELEKAHVTNEITALLNKHSEQDRLILYLTDLEGKVIFHSDGVKESKIDLFQIFYEQKKIITNPDPGSMYTTVMPVKYTEQKLFLVISGPLEAEVGYTYDDSKIVNLLLFFGLFTLTFYLFTARKMKQFQLLNNGVEKIAQGKLSVRLPVKSEDELGTLTRNINDMAGQLEEKMEKERLAEKTKIELITNISHDLRTPLTSIIGYLMLLQENIHKDDSSSPYVQSALNKSNQLKKLIDDLFEYTRLTSKQVFLEKQNIDMVSMLKQMIIEFSPLAETYDIRIVSELPEQKIMLHVDAGTIVRAVDNLLMNALKFSVKPGAIRIDLRKEVSGIVLCVANEGTGMTKEQEERLFERFYKGDESRNGHIMPSGSGLGLSIAQSIVQLHGGDIWLHRTGHYYQFFISIPYDSSNGEDHVGGN
ncbi:HAMP domain-containing sensor histidine kinase [Paenibacillus foliorum]|uniref:HAMP domain-containing sensor histidine kinase n=1 Tax=Paenibacillus foliorum TaxID=2654974 RepID=UPI001C11B3D0|nr:HAMP domain-containing sensor histidine kinase [Paenibacillus foliorum]